MVITYGVAIVLGMMLNISIEDKKSFQNNKDKKICLNYKTKNVQRVHVTNNNTESAKIVCNVMNNGKTNEICYNLDYQNNLNKHCITVFGGSVSYCENSLQR
ncbi:hypothetical protein AAA799E16_00234 [Marine Group I thaumarchaeote SCGC AAA799-E16]|uniref:Uncharacterized protein n=2 Tax=Marine Group I TaxID=905826 RepID=A0A087S189_9ARCH|nr:hypothetical protein AAA799E16_00234 [Marine Group I thaumarchaeote SCGC AAA799-E16]KFM19493.1 hypothetical protein SCCGRSA3_00418 [Marine Group I thaumarchaeote SCGC RSA3]